MTRGALPALRGTVRLKAGVFGGTLYILAVVQFLIFELVAETLYPGYSVARNYISDLGATCVNPPSTLSCVVHEPSARIFDVTVFILGLLLLTGAWFVYLATRKKGYFIVAAVADVATLLIGLFPENTGWTHAILSELAFFFTGASLVLATKIVRTSVMRFLTVIFGCFTLFFTITDVPAGSVGVGGQERILVLCALLGLLTLGGYLIGQESVSPPLRAGQDQETA